MLLCRRGRSPPFFVFWPFRLYLESWRAGASDNIPVMIPDHTLIGRLDGGVVVDPFAEPPRSYRLPRSVDADDADDGSWIGLRLDRGGTILESESIARAGSALAHLYGLAEQIGISPLHPPTAVSEAEKWTEAPGINDTQLEDLRHLPFITVDEVTSKDLDQALFVERLEAGFRVWYAIADAAHFVRPGSALMQEALRRGATYYMPGLVLPMLPPMMSEGIVSLNPRADRRALVFRIDLDGDGSTLECRILRARIHCQVKTSYDAVQGYYDGGPVPEVEDDLELEKKLANGLDALAEVGQARMRLAEMRHTVRVRRRELKVTLDGKDDLGFVAMDDPRLESELFNEQISLLANVEGAKLLARSAPGLDSVQPIFRFHQPPDPFRLERLRGRLQAFARRHRLPADTWQWDPPRQSLASFIAGLPQDGEQERLSRAIHRQALMAGGRSGFDIAPGIHHGVGAQAYARFTAPMREVVGIFVHKETWELLGEETSPPDDQDEALRQQIVDAANRSRNLQRRLDSEVNRRVIDQLFAKPKAQLGASGYGATVMGISRGKLHLQLDEIPIDVKVYIPHLEEQLGHRLRPGRDGVTLRRAKGGQTEWTLGDAVRVRSAGKDTDKDRWRLAVVSA